jgi:hypothetical protein
MSQRSPAPERLLREIIDDFPQRAPGISFANDVCHTSAWIAVGALGFLLSGCLVTDAIEPPVEPQTPPELSSIDYPVGSVIQINTAPGTGITELVIPMQVRDDDINEELKIRWRIDSQSLPDFGSRMLDYKCPEIKIPVSGQARRDWSVPISAGAFPAGACSRLEFAVSSTFYDCGQFPQRWDDTTVPGDVGHAVYTVWEVSRDPVNDSGAALDLLRSCPTRQYITNRPTAGAGAVVAPR